MQLLHEAMPGGCELVPQLGLKWLGTGCYPGLKITG